MSVSFVDGVLVIDEEVRLEVPTPLDIPVPTPPVVPSFEFPPIPDVAAVNTSNREACMCLCMSLYFCFFRM